MKKKLLWGLCFILVGVLLCFKAVGILDVTLFFKGWWTLFIIIPCFFGLFEGEYFGNLIGLLIGLSLLSSIQGWISFGLILKLIFPITLVLIGISILAREFTCKDKNHNFKNLTFESEEVITAIFSEQKVCCEKNFKGSDVEAIFGSVELDLRESHLDKETTLKVMAIFGGATILLPQDVKAVVKSTPIFGGVDNHVKHREDCKKTIYIDATAVFGGVDIR